jgi:SAM-dependent methyltransferase
MAFLLNPGIEEEDGRREVRCLDWDGTFHLDAFFADLCALRDSMVYQPTVAKRGVFTMTNRSGATTHWYRRIEGDLHDLRGVVTDGEYGLVVASQVFEHLPRPWLAMREVHRVLCPGGMLLFAAPFVAVMHGHPSDYYRYTVQGARTLAEDAGLEVLRLCVFDQVTSFVAGEFVGLGADYYTNEELTSGYLCWGEDDDLDDAFSSATIQVFMLARKPSL